MCFKISALLMACVSTTLATVTIEKINTCSHNEFSCNDGACVSSDLLCDGLRDCADGTDEYHCDIGSTDLVDQSPVLNRLKRQANNCRKLEWQCRDGSCIAFDGKCDGRVDCPDRSDESHAVCRKMRCQSNWFRCTYGACVDGTAPCNGIQECADNSDELLPRCRNETEDIRNEFKCKDGGVIPASSHCDGVTDCQDGSDEIVATCAAKKCLPYLFQCAYGACVDSGADCNGITECADGSDEADDLCGRSGAVTPNVTKKPSEVPKNKCIVPKFPNKGKLIAENIILRPGDVYDNLVLNVSCDPGHAISSGDTDTRVWCFNNQWLGNVQDCVRACQLIKHPSVEYKCRIVDNYTAPFRDCPENVPETMFVQPVCKSGFFSTSSLPYMRCSAGNWDYSPVCIQECGTVVTEGDTLTVGGRPVKRGEFPWHVGVYSRSYMPVKQICGGSVVSSKLVISAAHCFYINSKHKLDTASNYLIAAGKIYKAINSVPDSDTAQKTEVKSIYITPRYQGVISNYQEDIAIVEVVTAFEYTNYVKPVCVDFDRRFEMSQLVNGEIGKVAGWGYTSAEDERGSPELRVVEMPYVDITTCLRVADSNFLPYLTSDKICAGKTDGTVALCKGDSGGGLTFAYKMHKYDRERYYLRGITSTAPRANDDSSCNVYTFIAFTLISHHEQFIKEKLQI